MSDVVAVAFITGVSTLSAAMLAAVVGLLRERLRSSGEAARERAKAVRDGRRPAVEVLREWIPQNAGLTTDLGEILAEPLEDQLQSLVARLETELLDESSERTRLNAVLSGFSSEAIVRRVEEINEIRSKARAELKLLTPLVEEEWASLDTARQNERSDRLIKVGGLSGDLEGTILALNGLLEKYESGADV